MVDIGTAYADDISGERFNRLLAARTGAAPDVSLRPATPAEAEGLPAFGRGVELLASAVANTDWYAARWDRRDGVWQRLETQPGVVDEPDPLTDVWQWRYGCVVDLVEYGNHISLLRGLDSSTNRARYLQPLPIDEVAMVESPEGDVSYIWRGRQYSAATVLHISAGNRSGQRLGRGALAQYGYGLGHAVAAERYSSKWFTGGGLPPGLIHWSSKPAPEVSKDFKASWRMLMLTGEPLSLPEGVTVTPLAQESDKAQLVESRQWNTHLVAMVLGIPHHMLNLQGGSMTYQNVESADIGWVRDSVDRWAQPVAHAFSKAVLPARNRVLFDWASRQRTDVNSRATYTAGLYTAGVTTRDEARREVGYGPAPVEVEPAPVVEQAPDDEVEDEGGSDDE